MKFIVDSIKPILALLIVLFAFAYFFSLLVMYGKDDQVIIAIVSLTSLATGYYFGSNSGASKKDDTIATMAGNTQSPIIGNSEKTTINKQ